MKDLKGSIFIVIVLILLAVSAYPQRKFNGRVVEIIDGKTFVIELPTGKVTGVLQYVEIPESEQPFHKEVKEHLQKLILDKVVEFHPLGFSKTQTVGRVLLNGVDISQQMLRDGAAWYALAGNSQDQYESASYRDNEAQAKAEKRGVWSIENLKPAWEFRAEKAEAKRQQEKGKWESVLTSYKNQPNGAPKRASVEEQLKANAKLKMWADLSSFSLDNTSGFAGVISVYDGVEKIGVTGTPMTILNLRKGDFSQRVITRTGYAYWGSKSNPTKTMFAIGFLSESKEVTFLDSNSLTVFADKQKIVLGRAHRFWGQAPQAINELLLYQASRSDLAKIASAKKVELRIGKYSGTFGRDSQVFIKDLLENSK